MSFVLIDPDKLVATRYLDLRVGRASCVRPLRRPAPVQKAEAPASYQVLADVLEEVGHPVPKLLAIPELSTTLLQRAIQEEGWRSMSWTLGRDPQPITPEAIMEALDRVTRNMGRPDRVYASPKLVATLHDELLFDIETVPVMPPPPPEPIGGNFKFDFSALEMRVMSAFQIDPSLFAPEKSAMFVNLYGGVDLSKERDRSVAYLFQKASDDE